MRYTIFFEKNANRELERLDITQQRIITKWIKKNLENTNNPRIYGKSLKGNLRDYWRYRVGNYRIIAEINDIEVKILIINVGHRKDIYKKFEIK
jgi:mRNA interferase RelE/StbE